MDMFLSRWGPQLRELVQRQLIKVAREYLAQNGAEERFCRFDAVSVLQSNGEQPRLELVKNAFDLSGDGF